MKIITSLLQASIALYFIVLGLSAILFGNNDYKIEGKISKIEMTEIRKSKPKGGKSVVSSSSNEKIPEIHIYLNDIDKMYYFSGKEAKDLQRKLRIGDIIQLTLPDRVTSFLTFNTSSGYISGVKKHDEMLYYKETEFQNLIILSIILIALGSIIGFFLVRRIRRDREFQHN
jgi:hypothetical protein